MVPLETSYPITLSPGYYNTVEASENDLKFNLKKITTAIKEGMNKLIKEIQEPVSGDAYL